MLRGSFFVRLGPERRIGQQACYQLCVQGMAGFVGLNAGKQRAAYQRQIADQVERFVSAKLVGEPQGAVHNPAFVEDNGVVERAATNQSHSAQTFEILHEAKRSRGRQHPAERFGPHA